MISQSFQDEVWNKLNSIERRLSFAGGGGYAPSDAEFVVMSLNAVLPNERVLTAGIGLGLVDGGAGGNATVSINHLGFEDLVDPGADRLLGWEDGPPGFMFWATVGGGLIVDYTHVPVLYIDIGIGRDQIVQVNQAAGAAVNDYAKFNATGVEGRSYAEVLSDLSGQALAAFDWNAQNLTNIGTIAAASGSTIGNLTLANGSITDSGGAISFGNENLTTTGWISSAADADISSTFGRTIIGHWPGGANVALFSHFDRHNATDYALLQTQYGRTLLNAMNGEEIFFGINSTFRMYWHAGYLRLQSATAPIASIANSFLFYSKDIVAGNAAPHFRTENDDIVKLYKYVDADFGNAINSGDADTDDAISAIISALTAHGLIATV